MSLIWITNASYLTDYKIEIEFSTNKKGVVNLEQHVDTKIFFPLKDKSFFKNFKLNC